MVVVFPQEEAALPVRLFSLGLQCGHDNLVAFFKVFFLRYSSYFDLDLSFIGTMELTTWKSSAKTLQGLWSDSEEKQEQPLSSSSWSFLEALCLALSTYMTIITQSFLTRAFFITIILEAFCNNSEVPGKKKIWNASFYFFSPFTQNTCFLPLCTICFCGSGLSFLGNGCRSDHDWLCCQLDCSVSGSGTSKCSSEASK